MKTLFLLLAILLSTFAAARDPWVTQTGLTAAQLQSRLDTFNAAGLGLVPEQISGYEDSGSIRYAVLWGPRRDAVPRVVFYGLTAAALTSQNNTRQATGWRLLWINGFNSGGTDYYNVIYRQIGGAGQTLRLGDTLATHQSAAASLSDGHYLDNLSAHASGLVTRYAAFWTAAPGITLQTSIAYDLTAAQLNAEIAARSATWRVHNLCGNYLASLLGGTGGTRYTIVWRRPALPSGFVVIPGMDRDNFFAADSNQTGIGWRPAFLHGWRHGDGVKFNALWVPNGGLDMSYVNRIEEHVQSVMQAKDLPSMSLAISRQGRLVFKRAWGLADQTTNEWAGTNHRYRWASVAKPITGLAVVHAFENINTTRTLDSTVFGDGSLFANDYGSAPYSQRARAVTVRHLLHHTSGWGNAVGRLWWETHPAYEADHKQIIDYQLNNVSFQYDPGTRGVYNNFAYMVAARVVEKLSGSSFEDYTTSQIFAPCGITGILRPQIGERTRAERKFMEVAYYDNHAFPEDPEVIYPRRMDGSTGWIGRPSDLLLLARRVDGDPTHTDIINAASLTALRERGNSVVSSGYDWRTYGLGWGADSFDNPTRWGHNGSMIGSQADFVVNTGGSAANTAFAWVANSQGALSTTTLNEILTDITAANAWPNFDLFGVYHPAYQAWVAEHFSVIERGQPGLEPLLWAPTADPDGDGIPNAAEFYHGLDPRTANPSPYRTALTSDGFRIRWLRKTGTEGIVMNYRISTGLATWGHYLGLPPVLITNRPDLLSAAGYSWQELVLPANAPKRFVRFQYAVQ